MDYMGVQSIFGLFLQLNWKETTFVTSWKKIYVKTSFNIPLKWKKKNKKKNHMVGTIPKSNRKIVTRDKIDIPNTQIHDCSLICLGTGTSIKSGGVKLV
jgi:hypothetical protein